MGIISSSAYDLALSHDKVRLKRPEYHESIYSKNTRIAIREEKVTQNDFYDVKEDV